MDSCPDTDIDPKFSMKTIRIDMLFFLCCQAPTIAIPILTKKQQTLHAFLTILADLGCYQYFEHKDRKLLCLNAAPCYSCLLHHRQQPKKKVIASPKSASCFPHCFHE